MLFCTLWVPHNCNQCILFRKSSLWSVFTLNLVHADESSRSRLEKSYIALLQRPKVLLHFNFAACLCVRMNTHTHTHTDRLPLHSMPLRTTRYFIDTLRHHDLFRKDSVSILMDICYPAFKQLVLLNTPPDYFPWCIGIFITNLTWGPLNKFFPYLLFVRVPAL